MYVTCSYIPPNSDPLVYENHLLAIKSIADRLNPYDHLVTLGDFNIPTASWITLFDTDFLVPINPIDWIENFLKSLSDLNIFQINGI